LVKSLLPQVNAMQRTSVPASEIVLATKCGGSDGYSGITANPALGVVSDLLVAHGGTSILSETTELYGAEQLFTKRAASVEVAKKLLDKLVWWRQYTAHYGEDIDNNPSLGNKAGGLTTIVEKSLGAAVKGGQTALQDVIEYAEQTNKRGLVIMDAPGFDPVCVTGMVSGGANVVVFTTGRGSCFGSTIWIWTWERSSTARRSSKPVIDSLRKFWKPPAAKRQRASCSATVKTNLPLGRSVRHYNFSQSRPSNWK